MPFDPVLTLETAALMLVAFVAGATIGSLLHLAILRTRQAPVLTAATHAVSNGAAASALVAAPVIAPLAVPRDPVMSTGTSMPDSAARMAAAEPRLELAPARKAGAATSGRDVGRYDRVAALAQAEPAPVPSPEQQGEATHIEPELSPIAAVATPPAGAVEISGDTPTTAASQDVVAVVEPPAPPSAAGATAELPAAAATPPDVEAPAEPSIAAPDVSSSDADEVAAMRAIEGNWTPGRRPSPAQTFIEALPKVPAARKANAAAAAAPGSVPAIPAAAAAPVVTVTDDEADQPALLEAAPLAQGADAMPLNDAGSIVAVETSDGPESEPEPVRRPEPAIIAATPAPQDQPPGLGAPRHGMRDDLTQIVGILPIVETTLNRLGVYHFDQVAEWSDAQASWVEAHLGIAGRVEREHWREQAHELAAVASGKRSSRKKRPS